MAFKKSFFIILFFSANRVFACESHTYEVNVKNVIDGDTVLVALELGLGMLLKDEVIRLYGVDAPETKGREKEKGMEAKGFVEKTLKSGRRITVEIDPGWGKEKYGRRLGVIHIGKDNLNEILIELKLAKRAYY